MQQHGFSLVWVDKRGFYKDIIEDVESSLDVNLHYMSDEDWKNYIEKPVENLSKEEKRVPKDGHYSDLMNQAVAKGIAGFMKDNNLLE